MEELLILILQPLLELFAQTLLSGLLDLLSWSVDDERNADSSGFCRPHPVFPRMRPRLVVAAVGSTHVVALGLAADCKPHRRTLYLWLDILEDRRSPTTQQ